MKSRGNGASRGPATVSNEANMNRLLRELHGKKRWLDALIEGLEAAAESPDHQLVQKAALIFENLNGSRPKVDLGPRQQQILAELASQVRRRRGRRAVRTEEDKAA